MNQPIVCKFGGSSVADASCFARIRAIILSNPDRRYVVVSAPGQAKPSDRKITDLLYACAAAGSKTEYDQRFSLVADRFLRMAEAYDIQDAIRQELARIYQELPHREADYAASRGEYLNAKLLAACLGWPFLDAARVVRFHADGRLDMAATISRLSEALKRLPRAVIPGFYGATADGRIRTFARGGSDITGALVARAVKASLYENWTDISGVRAAAPSLIAEAPGLPALTYAQMRLLARCGATLLHPDCLPPVEEAGIPLRIRNTFAPGEAGTLVSEKADLALPCLACRTGFSRLEFSYRNADFSAEGLAAACTLLREAGTPEDTIACTGRQFSTVCETDQAGKLAASLAEIFPGAAQDRLDGLTLAAILLPDKAAEDWCDGICSHIALKALQIYIVHETKAFLAVFHVFHVRDCTDFIYNALFL